MRWTPLIELTYEGISTTNTPVWNFYRTRPNVSQKRNRFRIVFQLARSTTSILVCFQVVFLRRPSDSYIGQCEFLSVIDMGNDGFALRDEVVFVDVVTQQTSLYKWRRKKKTQNGSVAFNHKSERRLLYGKCNVNIPSKNNKGEVQTCKFKSSLTTDKLYSLFFQIIKEQFKLILSTL